MDKMQNFVVGYVVTAPDPATTGTSLTVSNGSLFPDPTTFGAYNLVCWSMDNIQTPANCEIVRVTAKTTSASNAILTITRAQESTTGLNIAVGWKVYYSLTQKYFDDLETALAAKEVSSNKVTSISGSSTDTQYPSAKLLYDQLALKVAVADFITHTPQTVTITDATPDTGTITTRPTGYHYDTFTAAIAADTTLTTSMSDGDAYEVLLSFSGTATVTFTGVTLPNAATTFTIAGVNNDKKSVVVKRIGSVYTGRTD